MNHQPATYWIEHLKLQPHPEGGFYKETYRASEKIPVDGLPSRFFGPRNLSTAIYFLLRAKDKSLFHRIKSDELWHFHAGDTLNIYVLTDKGLITYQLGPNLEKGDSLQIVIPANHWFGAEVANAGAYTLSSCTVSPGFDFKDFELANRSNLVNEFPQYENIIAKLTV
jgi:predicted cupin superfamily sugar epimerase